MVVATIGVLASLRGGSFAGFLGAFLALFVAMGLGNGLSFPWCLRFSAPNACRMHTPRQRATAPAPMRVATAPPSSG